MLWKIDSAHTEVNFTVRHMMITNVRGRFEKFEGVVDFNENTPTDSSVEVKIETASINTREPMRDGHLRSPDFLDAEKYPYLTFKSSKIEVLDSEHGKIYGDLTIRDVARPVVLDVDYAGIAKSPMGHYSAGFSATTRLNRKDWGLNWNVALETGGLLVGDEIKINIELELVKQAEEQTAAAAA